MSVPATTLRASLAVEDRLFRALANAMPQMVWSTLPDGYHDYYNDRWYEFTGVPPGAYMLRITGTGVPETVVLIDVTAGQVTERNVAVGS